MIFKNLILSLFFGFLSATQKYCNNDAIYNPLYNQCYQFVNSSATFPSAEQQCINYGGHLASSRNGEENAFIASVIWLAYEQSGVSNVWIGADYSSGSWKWTDGSPFNFSNWEPNQPGYNCGSQNWDGSWEKRSCDQSLPFVCAIPSGFTTPDPLPTDISGTCPTPPPCTHKNCTPSCDPAWTYYAITDSCYRIFHNDNWDDAERHCRGNGAHLTSIHSDNENIFVNNLAACGIKEGDLYNLAWIGLYEQGGSWYWSDGSRVDYLNWAPNQPDSKKELCGETAPDVSHKEWYEQWNNLDCKTEMRAYICKMQSRHV